MKFQHTIQNFHKKRKCMNREIWINKIKKAFKVSPVVAILGPRQCGKTTLAQFYSKQTGATVTHFDLEDPESLAQLQNPKLVLQSLKGIIIIDEIQRLPELFPILRVLVDHPKVSQQFLILGSASRTLIKQSSESLAGRITYIELTPFNTQETQNITQSWNRGGFPRSFLAASNEISTDWRKAYIRTYLEQDIPNLGFNIPPSALQRCWMMLTHYHGNEINFSDIGKSLAISDTTVKRYIDILSGTFMVRTLKPWIENIKKREVKTPKLYFRDTGIFHALLGISSHQELLIHPKLGASWEGFALEEVIRFHQADSEECYFWGIHSQAELDLLIIKDGKKMGFEFKHSSGPKLTKSMQIAQEALNLSSLTIIYPGDKSYPLSETINCIGLTHYLGLSKNA